ncbi:MAG: TolC family protein, partial [Candidatus Margulisiibacteriota bacterium]
MKSLRFDFRNCLRGKTILIVLWVLSLDFSASAFTLKESIEIALKNNSVVVASQKKVEAASARLAQAVGGFLPNFKIEGNYGRSYSQPSTVQITMSTTVGAITQDYTFGTDAPTDIQGLTASLNQPLFISPLFPKYAIAQKNLEMAREELRKTSLEISFNVTQAYFGVLKSEKMKKLAEESLNMAKTHLNQVKVMLSVGTATKGDLLRAEVQVANAEVDLTRAENTLALAKESFRSILNLSSEVEVELQEENFGGAEIKLPDYQELLKMAFNSRPEWKQYQLAKGIGEDSLRLAQTSYLPSLLLSAQAGKRITDYPTYRSEVNSWSVVGVASWNLFDGFIRENQIKEAIANLESQKAQEEQIKNSIALEVKEAVLNFKNISNTITLAKKAVEAAEESFRFSNERFLAGVGTNLEVISAQVSVTQARVNHLQSLF